MIRRAVLAAAIAWVLSACGGDDHDTTGARRGANTVTVAGAESVPGGSEADAPAFSAVPLPRDFPADFPIGPESTIAEASVRVGTTGTWSSITLVAPGDPGAVFEWYRDHLETAGWSVTVGSEGSVYVLHAMQGESYLDLATELHSEAPEPDWVRTHAEIWKVHP